MENAPIQPLGASYCITDDTTESRAGIQTCQQLRAEALYDTILGKRTNLPEGSQDPT